MSATRPISATRFARAGKRRLPPPPDEPLQVNFNDLPVRQVAEIERLANVSIARWTMAPSNGDQMAALVSVMYEVDFDVVAEETPRTLALYIEVVEDDQPDDEDAAERNDEPPN